MVDRTLASALFVFGLAFGRTSELDCNLGGPWSVRPDAPLLEVRRSPLFIRLLTALCLPVLAFAAEVPVETIELREVWSRGGNEDDVFFGNLDRVLADGSGTVYALDTQLSEVLVFDADGTYLRSIGGPGEGPGEFQQAADMYYGLGGRVGVLQAFPGKIVQLEPDGTPLENFRLPSQPGGGFQVVLRAAARDDRLVLAGNRSFRDGDQQMQRQFLEALSPAGELLTTFHEQDVPFRFGGMEYQEESFVSFQRRWVIDASGRVCAALDFHDYAIHVWEPDGTLAHTFGRDDVQPLERTAAQRETTQELFDAVTSFNPRSTFEIADHHATVSQLFARDDGELWVLTSHGLYAPPDGVAARLDVFDAEGAFVRQVDLRGPVDPERDALYMSRGRLYVVTDALGAAMSALGGGDGDTGEVEPSTLVCFDLEPGR